MQREILRISKHVRVERFMFDNFNKYWLCSVSVNTSKKKYFTEVIN